MPDSVIKNIIQVQYKALRLTMPYSGWAHPKGTAYSILLYTVYTVYSCILCGVYLYVSSSYVRSCKDQCRRSHCIVDLYSIGRNLRMVQLMMDLRPCGYDVQVWCWFNINSTLNLCWIDIAFGSWAHWEAACVKEYHYVYLLVVF